MLKEPLHIVAKGNGFAEDKGLGDASGWSNVGRNKPGKIKEGIGRGGVGPEPWDVTDIWVVNGE